MVLLDQRGDALGSLSGEPLFDLSHQGTGDSPPPIAGMNGESIDIAAPAVERPDDRTDQPPIALSHEYVGLTFGKGSPEVVRVVGDAGHSLGLSPQFKNRPYFLRATIPNDKTAH